MKGSLLCALLLITFSAADGPLPAESGRAGSGDHACRFWAMLGDTAPDSTLRDQLVTGKYSFRALGASNGNGWAVAYSAESLMAAGLDHPVILRAGPRANHDYDTRYIDAVDEMLAMDAHAAIVHVRAASSGHAYVPDPHPFWRGGIALAHNGTFYTAQMVELLEEDHPGYLDEHPPDFRNPYIDSELFTLYVLKLRDQGVDRGGFHSHALGDVIAEAVLRAYDAGALGTAANCAVTADDTLFVTRFDRNDQARYKARYRKVESTWIVCSEPVGTDTTGWSTIPPKSLAIFTPGSPLELRTIFPPEEPWLTVEKTVIDDDMSGQSMGNDDGGIDAGETVEILPLVRNEGGEPALQIDAELRVVGEGCVVLDSTTIYPDLYPGGVSGPLEPFVLQISPGILPGQVPLTCTLVITASGLGEREVWERTFYLNTCAPDIGYCAHLIDDGGNGHLEPGEEADVLIWLQNSGTEMATTLAGSLLVYSSHVEVLAAESYLDTLAVYAVDSLTPPARIAVSPTCPDPHILSFHLDVEADWGITKSILFDIPVGGFVDNMEGGTGAWTHMSGMPGYSDAWHLSTLQNHTPNGLRSWKCGAPDSGAVYPELLDAALVTPEITLCTHSELRFWHWIRAELSMGHFGKASDGGLVEASINGGPWQQVFPETGYDFLIAATDPPGPFPENTPVFSGWFLWRQAVVRIEGYTGTIQFRFRFGSNGIPGGEGLEGWYIDDVEILGSTQGSAAPEVLDVPLRPALMVGGPSPFTEATAILYDVVHGGDVQLSILDLEGRVVRHLVRGTRHAGRYRIVWDGCDNAGRQVESGLYFYRLTSQGDAFEDVRRVIRLR
jgi:predicted glutamine amidotransferase